MRGRFGCVLVSITYKRLGSGGIFLYAAVGRSLCVGTAVYNTEVTHLCAFATRCTPRNEETKKHT